MKNSGLMTKLREKKTERTWTRSPVAVFHPQKAAMRN
jgi:hypothetical protein